MRQKDRRKTSLLYCPEACKEDKKTWSALSLCKTLEKTKMIYKTEKAVGESISKFAEEKEEIVP